MRGSVTTTWPPRSARRGAAERLAEQGVHRAGWGTRPPLACPDWYGPRLAVARNCLKVGNTVSARPLSPRNRPPTAHETLSGSVLAPGAPHICTPAPGILTIAA